MSIPSDQAALEALFALLDSGPTSPRPVAVPAVASRRKIRDGDDNRDTAREMLRWPKIAAGGDQARDRSRRAGFNHHRTKLVDLDASTALPKQPME